MNNKGFVLLETLVVTIFTLFIFSVLYSSVVPLLGRYEEISYYNDLDTTYDLYHLRKFILNDPNRNTIFASNYQRITCNNGSILNQEACYNLFTFFGIDSTIDEVIFLNPTYIEDLKKDNSYSSYVRDYLNYINVDNNILILQNDGYVSYLNILP